MREWRQSRTRRFSKDIREAVSDRGRGVRRRGERPPTTACPKGTDRPNEKGTTNMNLTTTPQDRTMATVIAIMSMSLDGYVADTADGVDEVFNWYFTGDVAVPNPPSDMTFHVSAPSAAHLRGLQGEIGAMLTGRR